MASSKQIRDLSSSWGQKAQEILKNPSAVAAIASLGAHGLLFLALPLLPSAGLKATEPEIKQSVAMVELTPEEQQRLPDFSTLPPLDLPPLTEPSRPQPSDDLFSLSPLPTPPSSTLPPPGSLFAPPPLPLFIPSIPPPPRAPTFQIPLSPAPTAQPTPSPSPQETPEESPAAEEQTSPQPNETEVVATQEAPEATPSPSPSDVPQQTREEQLQARVDEIRSRREQLNQIAPDRTGTTEQAIYDNTQTWLQAVVNWVGEDQDINELNLEKVVMIEGAYPEAACVLRQSTNAVVAVLVDGEGKVVSEAEYAPKLIRGSGFRIFNQQAMEQAQAYTFEPTNKNEARFVQVNFIFNEAACPGQETASPAAG